MVHAVEQRMRKDVMSRKRKLFRRLQRLRNKFIEYVKLHVTFSLEKQQFFVFALKYKIYKCIKNSLILPCTVVSCVFQNEIC